MSAVLDPSVASDPLDVEERIETCLSRYKEYINAGFTRLLQFGGFGDIEVSAQGCMVRTASGQEYLDLLGGVGVFALGHRHPAVVDAVHRQLDLMPLSTRTFFQEPQALLAERLAQIAPGNLRFTFFSNSGTEAVEAAVKIARIATGRTDFISTVGAFHGKSMGSLAATGREKYRKPFEPMVPGYAHVPFDDLEAAAAALNEHTAAIIIEPIQGEGGINVPSPGYMTGLRRLCDAAGALLIVDEVQTGMGRTGRMFACQEEGVAPDIMTLAKALGGGVMPIGATLGTPEVWERAFSENPLIHTSTFGGNQLACAAALAALDAIEREGLPANAAERGAQFLTGLSAVQQQHPDAITAVRGRGLMIGIEFHTQDVAELTINGMVRRGVIAAYTLNNPRVIRVEPPLIITPQQVDTAIGVIGGSVAEAKAMLEGIGDS